MAIYEFPAVLTLHDDSSGYLAEVPDIDYCASSGNTVDEAIDMITDALSLVLLSMEENGVEIPKPTDMKEFQASYPGITTRITVDLDEYKAMLAMYPPEEFEDDE